MCVVLMWCDVGCGLLILVLLIGCLDLMVWFCCFLLVSIVCSGCGCADWLGIVFGCAYCVLSLWCGFVLFVVCGYCLVVVLSAILVFGIFWLPGLVCVGLF